MLISLRLNRRRRKSQIGRIEGPTIRMITPHDATQVDETDSEIFRILRLVENPTKSVVVQLSRLVQ
jgi:hypothetical protein